MNYKIINSYGCSIEGDLTEKELDKFLEAGWRIEETTQEQ